jgi:hypothetical protein
MGQSAKPERRHPASGAPEFEASACLWTFEENQTNLCLISFKVSGRSFQLRFFFATSQVWAELTKKTTH